MGPGGRPREGECADEAGSRFLDAMGAVPLGGVTRRRLRLEGPAPRGARWPVRGVSHAAHRAEHGCPRLLARAQAACYPTRTTCSVRGPCTPSTRFSSMSLVAEGPLIQVIGRRGVEEGDGVGHVGDHLVPRTTTRGGRGPASSRAGPRRGRGTARWCRSRRCRPWPGDDRVQPVQVGGGQPVVGYGAEHVPRQALGDHHGRAVAGPPAIRAATSCSPQRTTTAR